MSFVRALDAAAQRPRRVLLAVLVWHIVLWSLAQGDLSWSDPLSYAWNARALALGGFFDHPPDHPFWMRLGILVPVAALYRLAGVSVATTNASSLLAALLILFVVYVAAPTPRARVLGLVLAALSAPLAVHAAGLSVDLMCTALVAVAIDAMSRRADRRGAAWLALAMTAWFAAFLTKEAALWLAPAWLYITVADARAIGVAGTARRHAAALMLGLALTAGYLWLCAHVWGDPMARFVGIRRLGDHHLWSLGGRPASAWVHRLTWGPALLLLRDHGPVLIAAAAAPWVAPPRLRTWGVATATMIAMFWFGSASPTAYEPLPLIGRMALPALPGILVLAAATTDGWLARTPPRPGRTALVAGGLAIAAAMFARAVAPGLHPPRAERAAMAALHREVAAAPAPVTIVGLDERTVQLVELYYGFALPTGASAVLAATFAAAPPPAAEHPARVLVVVHRGRARFLERVYHLHMPVAEVDRLALPRLFRAGEVELQDAGDGRALHQALRAPP